MEENKIGDGDDVKNSVVPLNHAKNVRDMMDLQNACRVTVQFQLSHEDQGGTATVGGNQSSYICDDNEQPYDRRTTLKPGNPQKLELGHVPNPRFLYIENREGRTLTVVKSPEVVAELELKTLLVYLDENSTNPILVRAGQSICIEPFDASKVRIQVNPLAEDRTIQYRLIAVPK